MGCLDELLWWFESYSYFLLLLLDRPMNGCIAGLLFVR
jgi:hypothetical protein